MKKLVVALLIVAAFGAGFTFDRWLHRPLVMHVVSSPRAGIWPGNRLPVCTAFNNICWKTT